MLKLLLIIPILGCIPLMFIKSESPISPITSSDSSTVSAVSLVDNQANSYLKSIALFASLINLFISILI
jgi:hypothetical protein